jgi:peroxiredoxin
MSSLDGQPAPAFELPDTGGTIHSLADHRGRFLLLVFHRHLA